MIARTESTVLAYLQETRRKSVSYQTFDQASLSSTITNACSTLTLLLSVVSGVALLVAGIGIMNVMLVSVTERLREIGVRKAVGASDAAIFAQFFSEAFLLALAGCAGGLLLALIVGIAVYHGVFLALPATAPHFPWERALALTALVTSTITLIFGTYPAYQAMRRTPLEVLRAE
jgi:putative ABC transport system permease protein